MKHKAFFSSPPNGWNNPSWYSDFLGGVKWIILTPAMWHAILFSTRHEVLITIWPQKIKKLEVNHISTSWPCRWRKRHNSAEAKTWVPSCPCQTSTVHFCHFGGFAIINHLLLLPLPQTLHLPRLQLGKVLLLHVHPAKFGAKSIVGNILFLLGLEKVTRGRNETFQCTQTFPQGDFSKHRRINFCLHFAHRVASYVQRFDGKKHLISPVYL